MDDQQKDAFLLLIATPGIGYRTLEKLTLVLDQAHLTWVDFLKSSEMHWRTWGVKPRQITHLQETLQRYSPQAYAQSLQAKEVHVIFPQDVEYPELLRHIPDAPFCLFQKGSLKKLPETTLTVGVVGTRKMTEYGQYVTQKIVRELCQLQVTIISGLMYGVDLQAHQTAVEWGGRTVGVLGYGFEFLQSATYISASWLQEFFAQGNTLLSEYPPEMPPEKWMFLHRNRLIAGMSHAVIVTEAAQKSGSLRTAACAAEYNRLLCAVPGSIRSPFSQGTQDLLNTGATLVRSGYDVLKELGNSVEHKEEEETVPSFLGETAKCIFRLLTIDPLSADQISSQLELSPPEVYAELTQLEIAGYVQKIGSRWSLVNKL